MSEPTASISENKDEWDVSKWKDYAEKLELGAKKLGAELRLVKKQCVALVREKEGQHATLESLQAQVRYCTSILDWNVLLGIRAIIVLRHFAHQLIIFFASVLPPSSRISSPKTRGFVWQRTT